jgi:DNA-binding IclR family transcriptional regulator
VVSYLKKNKTQVILHMSENDRIATNLRTLLILEVVGLSDKSLTATEINAQIGLPKQTVHRLVKMLEKEGFLFCEPEDNKYRPTRRTRLLASGLMNASRFHIIRHQILLNVSELVKEAVNFVVPQESGMHYLDRVETDWPFRVQLPRGSNVPFHCTASGKCFLASIPTEKRKKFISALSLEFRTKNTITDPQKLIDETDRCLLQGFALDQEEFIEDMVAIAVPINDHLGRFVAALATHGPKQRMTLDKIQKFEEILKSNSHRLTDAMFS